MAAQRVPPSAWRTSQSSVIWRSPSAGEIGDSTQAAADEALNFLSAPGLFALGGFAGRARMGGAWQHAVFSGDPA